jgi:putative tryptophan/tyrosine transport system substrate-binding protein
MAMYVARNRLSVPELPISPDLERRKCLALLGGALAWPLAAPVRSAEKVRRIAVLINGSGESQSSQGEAAALRDGLKGFGWVEGRNLQIELAFESDPETIRARAEAFVASAPDAIVVNTNRVTKAFQQLTRTIPIVFAAVGDPVAGGLVASLAHPGGNITGITNLFFSIGGKWLELLKEIAPGLLRTAVITNPIAARDDWFDAIEQMAPMMGLTTTRVAVNNPADIERSVAAFAAEPNGGLIAVPPILAGAERELLLRLAREHRLPAIYHTRTYSAEGGLMSYGSDNADQFRQSASYVDRILRGAKPGELPVQFPSRFELVINRKTAQAMNLEIPPMLMARADELIE